MGERKQRILSALHAKRREARRVARERREEAARVLRQLRGEETETGNSRPSALPA